MSTYPSANGETPQLTWDQALAWRLARHHLLARAAPTDLVEVVGELAGVHAQVKSSAELSLWARIDDLDRSAVERALWTDRSLAKLWAMRGTLHLLPTAELELWLAALGSYANYGNDGDPQIATLTDAVARALDGRTLTREELARDVERMTGSPELAEYVRFSWGSYLKAASFRGLLCFAPGDGAKIRFTSPASWTGREIGRLDPDEALRAVTRRFLARYAPATPDSLTRWWRGGSMPRRGAQMLAALGDEAVEIDVDGQRAWALAQDVPAMHAAPALETAHLLPAFDSWVIAGSRCAPALAPHHLPRIWRNQGWISPVLLVNGRIAGVWRHERKGRRLAVALEPFDGLPPWAEDRLAAEAERLAAFFDSRLELRRE